jgi:hypothetical protein
MKSRLSGRLSREIQPGKAEVDKQKLQADPPGRRSASLVRAEICSLPKATKKKLSLPSPKTFQLCPA